jgi:hypothetical protein
MQKMYLCLFLAVIVAALVRPASAGIITAQGGVTALTDISEMGTFVTADFNLPNGAAPLNTYSGLGFTLAPGSVSFSSILPGIMSAGTTSPLQITDPNSFFPSFTGGGSKSGKIGWLGLVGTFSTPVTQVGVTFSSNGNLYLTAWNSSGQLIGQITHTPGGTAGFGGLDTGGTPIAMIAIGNDDVYGGTTYDTSGNTVFVDNLVFGNAASAGVPEPATLTMFSLGTLVLGAAFCRRKRPA